MVVHEVFLAPIYRPKIRRQRSKLHGWGVFLLEDINKNKRIVTYDGEKITAKESADREDRYLRRGEIWCFINHSCVPNCYSNVIDGRIWIIAGRCVTKGEELTYNYFTDGDKEIPCRCRPGCKNKL